MREALVKSEEFKDSPVGRIPKDWEVFKLSEVVPRAEYGISVSLDDEVGIPVLRMNNLKDGEVDLTDLKKSASFKAANLLLQPLDVLFNRTNSIEHVGRTAIWRGQIEQASFASYLVRLIPDQLKLIPEYLNIWLNFPSTQLLIRRYATPGVHQVNINPTNLRKVLIALPKEVSEQRRIVEILGSMDEAIARTSSLIAKLKQMKAGLLHDLLTRGLDKNGELRDAITHPEQFKPSPLGQIPKDWEVFKLSEIVPHAEYGISVSLDDEDGIPVLRMNNLKDGEVDLTDLKKSASSKAANLLLQPLDVLFNRTNSIEHVGRTAIWRGQIEQASFASYLVRLLPEQSKLIPEYLNVWLNLPTTQLLIRRYATPGVHQVNINPTNLRKVLIALPQKTSEQETIVERIAAHDTRIRAEEAYRNKLKLQKQGLMHDLLTGKVRVKNA